MLQTHRGLSQLNVLHLPLELFTARSEARIGSESRLLPTPPAFDAPVRVGRGSRRNIVMPFGTEKTRVVSLPNGKKVKIRLFVLTECTNVTDTQTHTETDRRTPHDSIGRACIASRGKNMETGQLWPVPKRAKRYLTVSTPEHWLSLTTDYLSYARPTCRGRMADWPRCITH